MITNAHTIPAGGSVHASRPPGLEGTRGRCCRSQTFSDCCTRMAAGDWGMLGNVLDLANRGLCSRRSNDLEYKQAIITNRSIINHINNLHYKRTNNQCFALYNCTMHVCACIFEHFIFYFFYM